MGSISFSSQFRMLFRHSKSLFVRVSPLLAKRPANEPRHGGQRSQPKHNKNELLEEFDAKTGKKLSINPTTGEKEPIGDTSAEEFATSLWGSLIWGAGLAVFFGLVYKILGG